MDRERLLILRDYADEHPPDSTDYQLIVREVLEDLLSSEEATIGEMLFALSVINLTPSVLYDKYTDSFLCMEASYHNVITYDENTMDIMSFGIHSRSDWFVSVQEALRAYIKGKLA